MPTREIRGRKALLKAVGEHETEAHFQAEVIKLARQLGWRCYHTHRSDRSEAGFPDLTMVRRRTDAPGRLIFAELKTAAGKVSPEQQEWLDDLRDCAWQTRAWGQMPEVYVWRPADWDAIVDVLR